VLSLTGFHLIPEPWVIPVLTACIGLAIGISIVQPWLRRTLSFWLALAVTCAVQLFVAYWIDVRAVLLRGSNAKGAGLLSLFVGFAVGVPLFYLLQKLKPSQEHQDRSRPVSLD
jgi:O-antigen ligase